MTKKDKKAGGQSKKGHGKKKSAVKDFWKDTILSRRQAGIVLMILGSFLITFIALFLYFNALRVQSLAEIFPANDTLLLVEVERQPERASFKRFSTWLKTVPLFKDSKWIPIIEGDTKWLENISLAFLKSPGNDDVLLPIIGGRVRDRSAALAELSSFESPDVAFIEESYEGFPFYKKPNLNIAFIGDFFLVAQNESVITLVLDEQALTTRRLANDVTYNRVIRSLPFGGNATITFVPNELTNTILSHFRLDKTALQPIIANIVESFTLGSTLLDVDAEQGFFFNTVLSPETKMSEINRANTLRGKYGASLLQQFPSKPLLLLGGTDLQTQWKRWQLWSEAHFKQGSQVLFGSLSQSVQRLFGEDVSVENDLISLIQHEYTFAAYLRNQELQYLFAVEALSPKTTQATIDRLLEQFSVLAPFLSPDIKEVTLPSGVTGRELVANPEASELINDERAGVKISGVKLQNQNWGLYTAIQDDHVLIATHLSILQEALEQSSEQSFRYSSAYKDNMSEVLAASDLVSYIDIDAWWRWSHGEDLPTWLAPFPTIVTSSKQHGDLLRATTFSKFR